VIAGLSGQILAPWVSALTALILLLALLRRRTLPLDHPNERSLHDAPVPRVGGLALVPAIAAGWVFVPTAAPWSIWAPAALLFALSFLDDLRDLPVRVRLVAHLIAAAMTAGTLVLPEAGWLAALGALLFIAWTTNLYNFMDGSDGLAGGMALIGFSGYAIGAWLGGAEALAFACLSISAASGVFLCFNFHPARVFLGDAGSIPLGFLAAALGVHGWIDGLWPVWFPPVVFSPFIVDASVTLMRRALRGERVWQAHRQHYYQRLVRSGWGHRRTALGEYVLMAACAAVGLAGMSRSIETQAALLAGCALVYLFLMRLIDRAWHRHADEA